MTASQAPTTVSSMPAQSRAQANNTPQASLPERKKEQQRRAVAASAGAHFII